MNIFEEFDNLFFDLIGLILKAGIIIGIICLFTCQDCSGQYYYNTIDKIVYDTVYHSEWHTVDTINFDPQKSTKWIYTPEWKLDRVYAEKGTYNYNNRIFTRRYVRYRVSLQGIVQERKKYVGKALITKDTDAVCEYDKTLKYIIERNQ